MVIREDIEKNEIEINNLVEKIFSEEYMNKYDNSVGSFSRDIVRAIATEIIIQKKFYEEQSKRYSIEYASGLDLDAICKEDHIYRLPAVAATGFVKIYGTPGTIIQKGMQVNSKNCIYSIDDTVEIPENGIVGNTTVSITALEAGEIGNAGIGEINSFAITYKNLEKVINEDKIINGKNVETDDELKKRRKKILSTIKINYNANMIKEMILENIKTIKNVKVIPRFNGKGTVKIVAINKNNTTLHDGEAENISNFLNEEIITDAIFNVVSVREKQVNIALEAIINKEYTEENAIELTKKTLNNFFLENLFKENRIYYADVINKLLEVKAFKKISNIDINNAKEDLILEDEDLVKISNITIKKLD